MTTTTYTSQDLSNALATMTTKDEAGRHFTERYVDDLLTALESKGFIAINRPIHQPTGIPYDELHWTVEVTEDGLAHFESWGIDESEAE